MLILGTKALLLGRPKLTQDAWDRQNDPTSRIDRTQRGQSRLLQPRIPAAAAGASRRPAVHAVEAVQSRLRRALVAVAAGDRPQIIARVFEDRPPDPQ